MHLGKLRRRKAINGMRRTAFPNRTFEMEKCNPDIFYKLSWFEMKVKSLFRIFDNLQVGLVEAVSSRDRAWLILSLFFALQVNSYLLLSQIFFSKISISWVSSFYTYTCGCTQLDTWSRRENRAVCITELTSSDVFRFYLKSHVMKKSHRI